VISNQQRGTVWAGKGGHAVRTVRNAKSIIHLVPVLRNDLVGKPLGKVEDALRIGLEGPKADLTLEAPPSLGRTTDKCVQPSEANGEGARLPQKVTSVLHGDLFLCFLKKRGRVEKSSRGFAGMVCDWVNQLRQNRECPS